MGGQLLEADWELVIGSSLVPHLLPGGLRGVRRPADVGWLPDGAYPAIVDSVGHVSLEDLLVVPAATWPVEPWRRRRRLYSPLCVMAIGTRGIGLWVQALPAPGVRAWVPLEQIAVVEQRADGPYGVLVVTGRAATLFVRYDDGGQAVVDAWTRRLRRRVAAVPAPIPPQPGSRGSRGADPGSLLLVPGDAIVSAGWRSRAGRGSCLLGVTSRELVIVQSTRGWGPPWRRATSTLCLPRGPVEDAVVRSRTMLLRSAGAEVRVSLRSRTVAAAASSWLRWMLSDRGRVRAVGRGDGKPQ